MLAEWAALLAATLALVLVAWHQNWAARVDAALLDLASYVSLAEPNPDIVVVSIDDRSVSEIGNWPWDRERHAELIDQLATYQPKLIVFDVLFVDLGNPESDARLAQAMGAAGNVILPHSITRAANTQDATEPLMPLPEFAANARAIGHVFVAPDPDGIVRRFDLDLETSRGLHDHLAKTTYAALGEDIARLPIEGGNPIAPMHQPGSFRDPSAVDVISGATPEAILKDKVVLIGATAQGLGDRYAVSAYAGGIKTGVEMQASLLSGMLDGELISEVNAPISVTVLVATIIVLFLVFWQFPPSWTLRVSLGLIVLLVAVSFALVVFADRWLPVFPAILGILLAYPVWGWRRLSSVSRFLRTQAEAMGAIRPDGDAADSSGFDPIAKQVSQVRGLIGETRERLSFLRRILSGSPDPMLVFDAAGGLILMNTRAEAVFGDEAACTGRSLRELYQQQGAQLDGDKQELDFPDDRVFLIASSENEMTDGGQIVSLRDISTIRKNEQQRREMLEFLSHDMRSPQAAIVGLVGPPGQALPEKERLARIEKQARRTLKLTDDFVQIARLEYEGVEPQETDLGALLHEAVDRAYSVAKRRKLQFETNIPDDPEFCEVDPSSMSRAIDNLIGNAIKFSPTKGTVAVGLERLDDNSIVISVSDNGPGLPAERVKDTFARFGARDTQAGPSAGLGLAYVKKVIDEHGAQIEVETRSDAGTRFQITLPSRRVP
ncbi:MAG: CHASE2 domain-containing protein [Pseudomonadota bacterium]